MKGEIMNKNKYVRHVFNSGLTLFYAKNKINKSSSVEINFDCGSRCDGEKAGLAHFCEHMFFTGTKTESKQEISKKYFDFIRVNAYTGTDYIRFVGDIFTKELKNYLALISNMINNSTFKPKAVEEEKKVVVQEIVGMNDEHDRNSHLQMQHLMYKEKYHLEGVLGTEKSVNSITSQDVKKFVKTYFVSNNCNVYVVSPLSFKHVKALVEENLVLNSNSKFEPLPYLPNDMTDQTAMKQISKDIDKNLLTIAFKVPYGYKDIKEIEALDMICDIVGDLTDGIMKVMRLERGLVYGASFYRNVNTKSSSLIFNTSLSKDNIKKVVDVLSDHICDLMKNGIKLEQLNKEKREKQFFKETFIASPRTELGTLWTHRKYQRYITREEFMDYQIKMKLEDLNNLIKDIFTNPKFVALVYGNAKKEDVYSLKELKAKFNCK